MAEQRKKSDSILLRVQGKTISLELFDSRQWPEECGGKGLYRVRINDVWHCPTGKYSFLTLPAVGELAAALLNGGAPTMDPPAPYLPHKARVRVVADDLSWAAGIVQSEPHQERDGRWYVWVWLFAPAGPRKYLADDVELIGRRQAPGATPDGAGQQPDANGYGRQRGHHPQQGRGQ